MSDRPTKDQESPALDSAKEPAAKVLAFKRREKAPPAPLEDEAAVRLLQVADDLDAVMIKHLRTGTIDARDLAGLMAHRLGNLMRHIDHKDVLWDVCRRILEVQAAIDGSAK